MSTASPNIESQEDFYSLPETGLEDGFYDIPDMDSLDSDLDDCYDVHEDVSRTFAMAVDKLSGGMQDAVCVAYLACRISDTIEDSSEIDIEKKPELLSEYQEVLSDPSIHGIGRFVRNMYDAVEGERTGYRDMRDSGDRADYWRLIDETHKVFNVIEHFDEDVQGYMEERVGEMTEGFEEFLVEMNERDNPGIKLEDEDDLERYNYFAAGTVGHLLTDLFTHERDVPREVEERLHELSEGFGDFLQTVNEATDVYGDFHDERAKFLPNSILKDNGLSHGKLADLLTEKKSQGILSGIAERLTGRKADERFTSSLDQMIDRANVKREDAVEYMELFRDEISEGQEDITKYLATPYALAVPTYRELKERPADVFTEDGLKIRKREAIEVLRKVDDWIEDNRDIRDITAELEEEELSSLTSFLMATGKRIESRADDMRELLKLEAPDQTVSAFTGVSTEN